MRQKCSYILVMAFGIRLVLRIGRMWALLVKEEKVNTALMVYYFFTFPPFLHAHMYACVYISTHVYTYMVIEAQGCCWELFSTIIPPFS